MNKVLPFLLLILLSGCEGFKVLMIHNASDQLAQVTVKPGIGPFDKSNIANYPPYKISDSTTFQVKPDSGLVLLSTFGYLLFNAKIKESDLTIDYLRIETPRHCIVADSKQEILELLRNKQTKYRRKTDKNRVMANGSNFGNIFIRN